MSRVLAAINAQLVPGGASGGIEQFVTGLVRSLGALDDGPDEYVVVTAPEAPDWLADQIGPNQRLETFQAGRGPRMPIRQRLLERGRRAMVAQGGRAAVWSEPFFDGLGADVVHFPYQSFRRCRTPTIFNPHDLQHCHHPEFFPPEQLQVRRAVYATACRECRFVATESEWVRADVVSQYALTPRKVVAIYRGAPTELYEPPSAETVERVKRAFELPPTFALYPAQTWPHKNHLALLEALARLRDEHSLIVPLVCTGRLSDFWPVIDERRHQLDLVEQVRFLGFVDPDELRALYRLALFVVLPSIFEGGGFPLVEAFAERVPAACSSATSLPEYAGDAALLFEPNVSGIADALRRMATDEPLRSELRRRGSARGAVFSWERTARAYRALYRQTAGQQLSSAETALLDGRLHGSTGGSHDS